MNLGFYNIGEFCSSVRLRKVRSEVDLSAVTFVSPFALVYLGMYLRHHNSGGHSFTVSLPDAPDVRDYIARQQFWERFNFDSETIRAERLRRLTTSTSLNDIVDIEKDDHIGDDIGDKVRAVLISNRCYVSPNTVGVMVSELVDNFAQHSGKNLAALALQYYPRLGALRLAIADCGMGIRASLSANRKHSWLQGEAHHVAAMEALKAGVSRKFQGGTGFIDVLNGVDELRGVLRLATGDEYILVRRGRAAYGLMNYNLPGVQIEISFPAGRLYE